MADLEQRIPMPPPFRREGRNADEPIMIGSSDDEDEDVGRPGPGRGTIAEQRARLHHNRTGTPIPRALEQGLRMMSPPPPLPQHHLHPWHRRPDWPHPIYNHNPLSIQQRLYHRSPDALRRLLGNDQVGRLLNMMFPGMGDQPPAQRQPEPEYDVRMTHARAKPRIGFSYDFAPDEDEESGSARAPAVRVRTRTTIVIPDSPPLEPVDRKGKGRAKTPVDIEVDEVLDLESDEWALSAGPSTSASVASPGSSGSGSRSRSRKRRAVETIEILSDDEELDALSKEAPVLVCASCRRPLRMGGERLWALRCGHMIDSRCYRKYGEKPIELAPVPVLPLPIPEPEPEAAASRPTKRRRVGGARTKAKAKAKPAPVPVPVAPVVVEPYQAETLEWCCPVLKCGRVHWSERIVNGEKSAWQPMKDTGAVGVFV